MYLGTARQVVRLDLCDTALSLAWRTLSHQVRCLFLDRHWVGPRHVPRVCFHETVGLRVSRPDVTVCEFIKHVL